MSTIVEQVHDYITFEDGVKKSVKDKIVIRVVKANDPFLNLEEINGSHI